MYRARDRVDNEQWLTELAAAADRLDLGSDTRSYAEELFLTSNPDRERSKRAVLAASLYAGALVASEERSQGAVADAVGVTRHTIQGRWKDVLAAAGMEPPDW